VFVKQQNPTDGRQVTRACQEEVNRLVSDAAGRQADIESKLAAVRRKIDGVLRAIEDGLYQPSKGAPGRA
jgi:hypothetical protein